MIRPGEIYLADFEEMESHPGLVKSWSCTSCAFIPISLRPFPPPCEGGVGGVMREPWKAKTVLLASREGCERTERERAWEDLVTGRAGTDYSRPQPFE